MFHVGNPQEILPDMSLFVHMIIMDSDTGTAMTLGQTYLAGLDVREVAHPLMQQLADDAAATVALGAHHGHDMVFLDIMHSYNGYRTCYYRTFICGEPNKHQIDAYEKASKWLSDSMDLIRPGVTPDEVAAVWPKAEEFGYRNEAEAFLLQYGHGVGLSLWERPIISRRYTGNTRPLKEGMVFALETWCGAADGSGAARIEEEVVVTRNGCEVITNFPSDHLISCGLPGCEVF